MSHRNKRFAAFAIFAFFYRFAASDSFSVPFGHQTIQRNDTIKSIRFGVRVPSDRDKNDSCPWV
jgi:hypothetical protein